MSKIFTVRLPEALAAAIDAEYDEYGYDSRAEYVRALLRERHRLHDQDPEDHKQDPGHEPEPDSSTTATDATHSPSNGAGQATSEEVGQADSTAPAEGIEARLERLESRVHSLEARHDSAPGASTDNEDDDDRYRDSDRDTDDTDGDYGGAPEESGKHDADSERTADSDDMPTDAPRKQASLTPAIERETTGENPTASSGRGTNWEPIEPADGSTADRRQDSDRQSEDSDETTAVAAASKKDPAGSNGIDADPNGTDATQSDDPNQSEAGGSDVTNQDTTTSKDVTTSQDATDSDPITTGQDTNGSAPDDGGADAATTSDTEVATPYEQIIDAVETPDETDTDTHRQAARAVLDCVRTTEGLVDPQAIADTCYRNNAPETMSVDIWWDAIARPVLQSGIEAGVIEYSAKHQCYRWVGHPSA